jgi:hypothetical protein
VLDRRQPRDREGPNLSTVYYQETFTRYIREVFESTDESALGDLYDPDPYVLDTLSHGVDFMYRLAQNARGWSDPVRLAGHARVLAVGNDLYRSGGADPGYEPSMLATPLYVEYSSSKSAKSI